MSTTTSTTRAQLPAAGTWTIDPAHTSVEFVAKHLMFSKVRGRFPEVAGTITVAERIEDSRVEVEIATNSVTTGDEQRDAHLRSADFFGAETHPAMTFRSTAVRASDDGWKMDGELTIRDVTRPVTLDVEYLGAEKDPWGNTKAGFSASTEVDREDFGLTWNQALETGGVLVGKRVRIEIEVQAAAA